MIKKKLPLDIFDFKELIEGNYLYVDKTKIIYELLENKLHFLSRPRRFGKTLLLSTLENLFSGNKELFKDTWIYQSDYQWQQHPIIKLDFSNLRNDSAANFEQDLNNNLDAIAHKHGLSFPNNYGYTTKFKFLVETLSTKNKVVVLIDEYDSPLISNITNTMLLQNLQKVMHSLFATIKSTSNLMRFFMLTGVSRFSKTSIFSGLNNLIDITLNPLASDLLGYTQEELEMHFNEYIVEFAHKESKTVPEMSLELKKWYNGYRFSSSEIKVYNPFSIINACRTKELANYWLSTGIPSFLVKLLPDHYDALEDITKKSFDINEMGTCFEVDFIETDLLLYQAGFLTITDYCNKLYYLDFPNEEVGVAFNAHILGYLSKKTTAATGRIGREVNAALKKGNLQIFYDHLKAEIAAISYIHQDKNQRESFYHMIVYMFLRLIGLPVQSELSVSTGRLDLVLETSNYIYIFELKLNKTPEIALHQIEDKRYTDAFLQLGKKIVLVGLNYCSKNKELQIADKKLQ